MFAASIKDDLRSFRRSWVHHTGMQLATLTVLAGTLFVVGFVLSLSFNVRNILASWGNGVHMTVYLNDDVDKETTRKLDQALQASPGVEEVTYVPREAATANFKTQMATYAPGLLSDTDFANPFPASFRVSMKDGVISDSDIVNIQGLAGTIAKLPGVEDVSYGQSWIQTYSSIVTAFAAAGGILIAVLLAGGIFVVGNSVRASISSRREEIEILELVGATKAMIRRPYIVEGFLMGGVAAIIALILNLILHHWEVAVISSSVALGRVAAQIGFMGIGTCLVFVFTGALIGASGAWLTIRKLNDGWSASHRIEA